MNSTRKTVGEQHGVDPELVKVEAIDKACEHGIDPCGRVCGCSCDYCVELAVARQDRNFGGEQDE